MVTFGTRMDGNSAVSNAVLMNAAREGARKALLECLRMRAHEILGAVWDDTSAEVFSTLSDAASEAGVEVRHAKVSLEYQSTFGCDGQPPLEREIRDVLNESSAIITCTSNPLVTDRDNLRQVSQITSARFRLLSQILFPASGARAFAP
jgi:hypothetical protein